MRIDASDEAGRFVRGHGGTLYVWFEELGRSGLGNAKAATKPPQNEISFERIYASGFEVMLDSRLERPARLALSLRRWPRRRIHVRGFRRGAEAPIWSHGGFFDSGGGGNGGGGGGNGGGG